MVGVKAISTGLTSFGAKYSRNKDAQVSTLKVNDPLGCRMYALSKVVKLAELVPEDEFITVSKSNRKADGRNLCSLCTLGCLPNSTLILRTSPSFPEEVHKEIAELLESKDIASFDEKTFIRYYDKKNKK